MIPLEVVQGRMASQDGQNGALQFDPQLVAVLVSHVWTGESQGQGGQGRATHNVRKEGAPCGKLTRLRSMSRRTCRSSSRGGNWSKSQLDVEADSFCFPFALERSKIGLHACVRAPSQHSTRGCDAVTCRDEGTRQARFLSSWLTNPPVWPAKWRRVLTSCSSIACSTRCRCRA